MSGPGEAPRSEPPQPPRDLAVERRRTGDMIQEVLGGDIPDVDKLRALKKMETAAARELSSRVEINPNDFDVALAERMTVVGARVNIFAADHPDAAAEVARLEAEEAAAEKAARDRRRQELIDQHAEDIADPASLMARDQQARQRFQPPEVVPPSDESEPGSSTQ